MFDAYPLQWPAGRQRTPGYSKNHGNLNKMPGGRVRSLLRDELRKMGVDDFVVSSNVAIRNDGMPYANQRPPEDSGVVLYFTRKGQDIAISCDAWYSVDANLRAIGLTIEAIRGMERWGTEEMIDRAFTGFAALPQSTIVTPSREKLWYEVLGVQKDASADEVKRAYRKKLMSAHPDYGGSAADFIRVKNAMMESGYNEH